MKKSNNIHYNKYKKYKSKYMNLKTIQVGMGNNKEIYVLRHGETDWNKLGKSMGQEADIPINDNGREQARKTAEYLKQFRILDKQFDCIYASPMIRAKESAQIIQKIIGFDKDIQFDDLLKESKQGKISGLPKTDSLFNQINEYEREIQSKDPIERYINKNVVDKKLNEHFDIGYETDEEVESRANEFIQKLLKTDCKKILIVAHGGLLLSMIRHLFKLSKVPEGDFKNGGNCWLSYITYNDVDGFRLVSPPNTEHLGLV